MKTKKYFLRKLTAAVLAGILMGSLVAVPAYAENGAEESSRNEPVYQFGWNELNGERYYLKKDGSLATSSLTIGGIRYKFDKNGVCRGEYTGFTKSSKGKRYWKSGTLVKNKWIWVKGERKYYAGADGYFTTETPAAGDSPKISVKFPDGAVYESTDGGKSWTIDGKAQTPSVYAKFEGEYPVRLSGRALIRIGNESSPFLIFGESQLLREENGEWIKAEIFDKETLYLDLAYVIQIEQEAFRFWIPTYRYVPLEGNYRYTLKLLGPAPENEEYQITVDFRATQK